MDRGDPVNPLFPVPSSEPGDGALPLGAFVQLKPPAFAAVDLLPMMNAEAPAEDWLLPGYIPLGVPGVLAGRPSAGKSMLTLQFSFSLALGVPFLGMLGAPKPSGVLYLCMEDSVKALHHRVWSISGQAGVRGDPDRVEQVARNLQILTPDCRRSLADLALPTNEKLILETALKIKAGCSLIVVDTQSAMFDGDENSARDTSEFWGVCRALSQETGATVLVLHHVRKSADKMDGRTLPDRLNPENLRGSSAGEGHARFMLIMAMVSSKEAMAVDLPSGAGSRDAHVVLSCSKLSSGALPEWLLLQRGGAGSRAPGLLTLRPDSSELVRKLQLGGASAKGEGRKNGSPLKEKVLLAIACAGGLHRVQPDHVMATLWPGVPTARQQWKRQVDELTKAGMLEDGQPSLKGQKALGIVGKDPASKVHPEG